ncbi:MAG: DinB family protein, partial [Cellulomonas sp.]|nr:DinB family protein [Cellulomonas sp.]
MDEIDEAHFVHSPPIGGWSISEVYAHIFDSSLLSLMAIARIIKGDGELQPTHWAVRLILFFGSLPPGKKYEAPARLKERVKKINKMAAQQLLTDFELQLAKIYPLLEKPVSGLKVKHPRLGYLDAKQWFRFIEIHLK